MTGFNHEAFQNYGVREYAPITAEHHEIRESLKGHANWNDPELARIVRLRLLSDPGFPVWDVSYCWGQMKDGSYVDIELPFSQLPKRNFKEAIVLHAKRDGVYAKGLGVFEAISTLC